MAYTVKGYNKYPNLHYFTTNMGSIRSNMAIQILNLESREELLEI